MKPEKPTRFLDGTPIRKGDIKRVMFAVMKEAYGDAAEVTGDALARDIMYAARNLGEQRHGLPADAVDSKYFTQRLLREFLAEHPQPRWNVAWDERGFLIEPHTTRQIQLGTREVREYVAWVTRGARRITFDPGPFSLYVETVGPVNCFQALLFVEKAGLVPPLQAVEIPARFDIAIGTTRGQSTTGARHLIEFFASEYPDLPIFVAHDLDVFGLSIASVVGGRDTSAHTWVKQPNLIDIGLRLTDIDGLISESVSPPTVSALDLTDATEDEREFLLGGRRAELNSLVGRAWPEFIERKLVEHGVLGRMPIDAQAIEDAYVRAVRLARLNAEIESIKAGVKESAVEIPDDLVAQVTTALAEPGATTPWDVIVASIAEETVEHEGWF